MARWKSGSRFCGICTHVADGDTIVMAWDADESHDGLPDRVRLAEIQAPELYPVSQPGGAAALVYLRHLVEGRRCTCIPVRAWPDRYGRMLARVCVRVEGLTGSGPDGLVDASADMLGRGLVVRYRDQRQRRADRFRSARTCPGTKRI